MIDTISTVGAKSKQCEYGKPVRLTPDAHEILKQCANKNGMDMKRIASLAVMVYCKTLTDVLDATGELFPNVFEKPQPGDNSF